MLVPQTPAVLNRADSVTARRLSCTFRGFLRRFEGREGTQDMARGATRQVAGPADRI
jgi:hypothetical protein